MKKKWCVLFLAVMTFILTGCAGHNAGNKPITKIKTGEYTLYKVKIKKITHVKDSDDWFVKGTTDAPDGTKIVAASATDDDPLNASSSANDISWPKVKKGKFKMHVSAILAVDGDDYKAGLKSKVAIFGIKNYKKKSIAEVPEKLLSAYKKKFKPVVLTMNAKQADYINNLNADSDDDDDDSDSDSSSSSSSASSSSAVESYQTVTYDQLARTPKNYEGKGVKIQGQVMQVQNSKSETAVLLWMNDDSDSLVMIEIDKAFMPTNGNILEDDEISVSGIGANTQKYTTTDGEENEVPLIAAAKTVTDTGKSADAD